MRSVNDLGFGIISVAILFFAINRLEQLNLSRKKYIKELEKEEIMFFVMLLGGLAWTFYKLLTEEIETMESGDKP